MLIDSPDRPKSKLREFWPVALLLDLGPKLLIGIGIMLPLQLSLKNGLIGALGASPTLACFMVGSFVIHMWTRPDWQEILGGVACGAVLGFGYTRVWGGPNLSILVICASFLGVGSLAILAIRSLRLKGEPQREKFWTLVAAATLPFIWIFAVQAIALTPTFCPRTYDLYLYAFDSSLGFQPSFSVGRFFQQHLALRQACELAYSALPLDVSFLYGWHRMNRERLPVNILWLFFTVNVAGFLLYYCYPATGPVYAFGNLFPWSAPDLRTLLIQTVPVAVAPRNAMPSVHVAATLLVFWNSSAWPKWARAITAVFLFLTVLATLGFGEHYLVDLVVAVPFSLAVQAAWTTGLSWKAPERWNAFLMGSVAVAVWFVLLRIGPPVWRPAPVIAWSAVAATIVPALILRRRLVRAANPT